MEKRRQLLTGKPLLILIALITMLVSCTPAVNLTASWHDVHVPTARFEKILVLSIGKSLEKRKLGEDKIKSGLQKNGFNAEAGLDFFSPDFSKAFDSAKISSELLNKGFDGVLTVRVISVEEDKRWVRAAGEYYYPENVYLGFYRYYNTYGWVPNAGYLATDVKVLLESNLYNIKTGTLLWSGQSTAFSRNPTPEIAERYAKNIIADMLKKNVIAP